MSIQRVIIINGRLQVGGYFGGDDPRRWDPGVEFDLVHKDGTPVRGDYKGDAWLGGGELNIDRSVWVEELLVADHPTIESVLYQNGWFHAMKQKRRRVGDDWPSDFLSGWRSAWEERKKVGV